MMRKSTSFLGGLATTSLVLLMSTGGLFGQVPIIKETKNTIIQPLKDTQQATKEATSPIKDARQTVKEVTNTPKDINREIKNTEKGFQNAEKELEGAKKDVDKLTPDKKGDKGSGQDSTGTKKTGPEASDGKGGTNQVDADKKEKYIPPDYVPGNKNTPAVLNGPATGVDPNDVPRPVPPGSRDNKTPSGPMPEDMTKTVEPDAHVVVTDSNPDPESNTNLATAGNAGTDGNANANSMKNAGNGDAGTAVDGTEPESGVVTQPEKYVTLNGTGSGTKRPRPDYSNSPARIALEKAEYDIETLEDLFKYSNWEGPEREHTVRAVEYALDELQQSIIEIKKLDPGHSTWRFEERYKEMRAAFQAAKK